MTTSHRPVIVIGAGPAGAAAARCLEDAGVKVLVLESEQHAGGRTATLRASGYSVDSGAIFVMGSYRRTLAYLKRSGHRAEMSRWKSKTALREGGELYRVRFDQPASFLRLPQLTWRDRLRMVATIVRLVVRGPAAFNLRELEAADNGETMEAWSRRVLGDRVHEYVVRPLMEPLTGADLSTISRSFLMGLLHDSRRTRLTVPAEGVDRVTAWQLEGVNVRYGVRVNAVERTESGFVVHTSEGAALGRAVVIATDAWTAAKLGASVLPNSVRESLESVQVIPLHHVAFVLDKDVEADLPDLVVPVGRGAHSDIGVLLNDRRRPGSSPGGQVVSVYFDGPRSATLKEPDLIPAADAVAAEVLGHLDPVQTHVWHRPYGLSTAAPGHYAKMMSMVDALPADVQVAGDYVLGCGIEAAYVAGEEAAGRLTAGGFAAGRLADGAAAPA